VFCLFVTFAISPLILFCYNLFQVEVLVPLNDEVVLDVKYLPEEDMLALVAKSGSISIFDLNSSMVHFQFSWSPLFNYFINSMVYFSVLII